MRTFLSLTALALSISLTAFAAATTDATAPKTTIADDSSARETFVKANTAYESQSYEQAIGLYRSLIDSGYSSGPLYYNLGNAELRAGSLGRSIVAYRQATALLPRDGDLAANLKYARDSTKDDLGGYTRPMAETIFFWHKGLGVSELAMGVLVINAFWWILLVVKLYLRENEILLWATRGSLVLLLALGSSLIVRVISPDEVAVVQPMEVSIYSGTSNQSTVLFKLHEGSELKVVEASEDWIRVSLPDDKQGWLPSTDVAIVEL